MGKVIDALKCKCPNCKDGRMFNKLGNFLLFKVPKMNVRCKECNFKFEKEPGFFFGAMFVSYALVAAEMITSVIVFKFFVNFSYINVLFATIIVALLLSTINFRVSRSIWVRMFYNA
tara:strand:- start:46014 stop:46364 length:351 start_codon:yes stop_codon:yes gene_type:complete